jgi:hypothetical protein
MVVLLIILGIPLSVLAWTLFVPYRLEINTPNNAHNFRLPGLLSLGVYQVGNKWQFRGKILLFNFQAKKKSKNNEGKRKVAKNRKSPRPLGMPIRQMWYNGRNMAVKVFKSVRIKKIKAEVDSGDFPLNAQLYPLVPLLGMDYGQVEINFENRNSLELLATGQMYRIVFPILWFFIKQKLYSLKNK